MSAKRAAEQLAKPSNVTIRGIKLTVSHIGHVVFLSLLMVVIGVRAVINAAVVVLLPLVLFGLFLLLTWFLSTTVAWIIIAIVGTILILLLAYGLTYLNVFKQTVWTIMFIEMSKEKDLDTIGGNEK